MLEGPPTRGLPASTNGRNMPTRISQAKPYPHPGALPAQPGSNSPAAYSPAHRPGDAVQRASAEQLESGTVQPHGAGGFGSRQPDAVAQQEGVNFTRRKDTTQTSHRGPVVRITLGREQAPRQCGRGGGLKSGVPLTGQVPQRAAGYICTEAGGSGRRRPEGPVSGPLIPAERLVREESQRSTCPSHSSGSVDEVIRLSQGAFGARRHDACLPYAKQLWSEAALRRQSSEDRERRLGPRGRTRRPPPEQEVAGVRFTDLSRAIP